VMVASPGEGGNARTDAPREPASFAVVLAVLGEQFRATAPGGDELADGAECVDEGLFGGLVFFGWRGLDGAGFRAVGRGIGEGPILIGGLDARNVKNQDLTPNTRPET